MKANQSQNLDTPQSGIVKTPELNLCPTRARIIHSDFSQHTLHVSRINADECPSFIYISNKDAYTEFYVVRNQDAGGMIFMYLGKGNKNAPKEIVAWYPRGAFWRGYGTTIKAAIEGAQRDGWLYA